MQINGNEVFPDADSSIASVNVIAGNGLYSTVDNNGNTVISALTPIQPNKSLSQSIKAGPGLILSEMGNGDIWLDTTPQLTKSPAKPIFMIGLPSSSPPDELDYLAARLETKLPDYHVLLLRNTTDTYTAKVFSEQGGDTLPISDIKKYIDQKLR